MDAVTATEYVTQELKEINAIVEVRARDLKRKEQEFRTKVEVFEEVRTQAFENLQDYADELFHEALQKIKHAAEDQALRVQSVLEKSEIIVEICAKQKTELADVTQRCEQQEVAYTECKKQLLAEQKRSRNLNQRVLTLEREKQKLTLLLKHKTEQVPMQQEPLLLLSKRQQRENLQLDNSTSDDDIGGNTSLLTCPTLSSENPCKISYLKNSPQKTPALKHCRATLQKIHLDSINIVDKQNVRDGEFSKSVDTTKTSQETSNTAARIPLLQEKSSNNNDASINVENASSGNINPSECVNNLENNCNLFEVSACFSQEKQSTTASYITSHANSDNGPALFKAQSTIKKPLMVNDNGPHSIPIYNNNTHNVPDAFTSSKTNTRNNMQNMESISCLSTLPAHGAHPCPHCQQLSFCSDEKLNCLSKPYKNVSESITNHFHSSPFKPSETSSALEALSYTTLNHNDVMHCNTSPEETTQSRVASQAPYCKSVDSLNNSCREKSATISIPVSSQESSNLLFTSNCPHHSNIHTNANNVLALPSLQPQHQSHQRQTSTCLENHCMITNNQCGNTLNKQMLNSINNLNVLEAPLNNNYDYNTNICSNERGQSLGFQGSRPNSITATSVMVQPHNSAASVDYTTKATYNDNSSARVMLSDSNNPLPFTNNNSRYGQAASLQYNNNKDVNTITMAKTIPFHAHSLPFKISSNDTLCYMDNQQQQQQHANIMAMSDRPQQYQASTVNFEQHPYDQDPFSLKQQSQQKSSNIPSSIQASDDERLLKRSYSFTSYSKNLDSSSRFFDFSDDKRSITDESSSLYHSEPILSQTRLDSILTKNNRFLSPSFKNEFDLSSTHSTTRPRYSKSSPCNSMATNVTPLSVSAWTPKLPPSPSGTRVQPPTSLAAALLNYSSSRNNNVAPWKTMNLNYSLPNTPKRNNNNNRFNKPPPSPNNYSTLSSPLISSSVPIKNSSNLLVEKPSSIMFNNIEGTKKPAQPLPLVSSERRVTESAELLRELTRRIESKKPQYIGWFNRFNNTTTTTNVGIS